MGLTGEDYFQCDILSRVESLHGRFVYTNLPVCG